MSNETNADHAHPKAKQPRKLPGDVYFWYVAALTAFSVMSLTLGKPEDLQHLGAIMIHEPGYTLGVLLLNAFLVLIPPLIHFGLFAMFDSKRNMQTFARILRGWHIALLCFVVLGFLAGISNQSLESSPGFQLYREHQGYN